MRWLVPLFLMSCADQTRCTEAPLAGNQGICTRIEGNWLLQAAMDTHLRCGADLLSNPVTIVSKGSELSGNVGGSKLTGTNYASGSFTISERSGRFSLNGDYRVTDGGEPELVGGVAFGGFGQTCDALWDFTARRE